MIPVERIKKLSVFQDVPAAALERLAANSTLKSFQPGEEICGEGEKGEGLFVVVSGLVTVDKNLFHGDKTKKTVARLGPGQFFGEMAFLQNQPYSATVSAHEPSDVLVMSRAALNDVEHFRTIMTGLSDRLRATTRELVTVFEVARVVGLGLTSEELSKQVVDQLSQNLSPKISIAFYKWNPFNDEYTLLSKAGTNQGEFPGVWEPAQALTAKKGFFLFSPIDVSGKREGLLLYHAEAGIEFSSGEKQMIETLSAVLAPALTSARFREEEMALQRFKRSKQEETYS